jgi:hypothetical protein
MPCSSSGKPPYLKSQLASLKCAFLAVGTGCGAGAASKTEFRYSPSVSFDSQAARAGNMTELGIVGGSWLTRDRIAFFLRDHGRDLRSFLMEEEEEERERRRLDDDDGQKQHIAIGCVMRMLMLM